VSAKLVGQDNLVSARRLVLEGLCWNDAKRWQIRKPTIAQCFLISAFPLDLQAHTLLLAGDTPMTGGCIYSRTKIVFSRDGAAPQFAVIDMSL